MTDGSLVDRDGVRENGAGRNDDRPHDPSALGGDVSACDREQIHLPGSIQPHGLLLIVDPDSLVVAGGAGDIEGRLSRDWLGAEASVLLGQDVRSRLDADDTIDGITLTLDPVDGVAGRFSAILHRTDTALLVELEPEEEAPWSASRMLVALDTAASGFERAPDLRALCDAAAGAFQDLTGYDRVMIYRFLDDDAGVVVAERVAGGMGGFLNHQFPASDIPRQARALYVRNRVRVIPDIRYAAAPLRPEAKWHGLDLSAASLRSVSPVHLQYLANMGVGASASMSIVKDGELWGLVACHNATARPLSFGVRTAARALAGDLARQIRVKEEAEVYRDRVRLRSIEDTVLSRLGPWTPLLDFLGDSGEDIRRMMDADGFVALQGRELVAVGKVPDEDFVRSLGRAFSERALSKVVATASLGSIHPPAEAHRALASGFLAATMTTEEPTVLMWFRAEEVEVLNWAGNPHKAVSVAPGETLTPRASFEAWSEAVRGRARAWTLAEAEAAGRLTRTLLEARQTRRLRELNRELVGTIADKEALIEQKNYLMREVNHRVQNSLQLVSSFLALQARDRGNDVTLESALQEAQRRLSAVALVHRRLYADDKVEVVDLARYLEDLMDEMLLTMDGGWRSHVRLDLSPILTTTDRAVNIGLILTELVINANKYAYDGGSGPIAVTLDQHRNRLRLVVADSGAGKRAVRQGFGTRMLKAMVQRLSGEFEEQDNMPGLRVVLTAPIDD